MKSRWIVKGFEIAILITIVIAGFGQAVLQLWNRVIPDIFALPAISFWQALGLLALCRILFGGARLMGMGNFRHRRARWEQMTPEQRESFRKGLQSSPCRRDG